GVAPYPVEQIEANVGSRVTEVCRVVGRDAAHVDRRARGRSDGHLRVRRGVPGVGELAFAREGGEGRRRLRCWPRLHAGNSSQPLLEGRPRDGGPAVTGHWEEAFA